MRINSSSCASLCASAPGLSSLPATAAKAGCEKISPGGADASRKTCQVLCFTEIVKKSSAPAEDQSCATSRHRDCAATWVQHGPESHVVAPCCCRHKTSLQVKNETEYRVRLASVTADKPARFKVICGTQTSLDHKASVSQSWRAP